MELAIIILLAVILVVGVILLFVVLKRKGNSSSSSQEISDLKASVNNVDKLVEKTVNAAMAESMVKLTKEFGENTQKSSQNLNHFQGQMTEFFTQRMEALNKQLDEKIATLDKKVDEKLKEGFKGTSESMAQVRERLQTIDDAQKNIENLSKDVVSLKQVLEGNQSRGQYGEFQLQMVLHNIFGDTEGCYKEQYTMHKVKDGDDVRADAVVFLPEPNKMIAIDSKFPFQDYSRVFDAESEEEKEIHIKDFAAAVKKHITAIASKYIVEGKTAQEAIMFIPNDGVFAFIHHNCQDVIEYSREKKVVITSPSTLPPILTTINMVKIQVERAKNAAVLSKELQKLSKDFEMFGREWDAFNNALDTATRKREAFDHRVDKLTNKFDTIKSNGSLSEIEAKEELQIQDNN